MNRVAQMITLQQQLNDATNGEEWENGVTKDGKSINWRRCIYMEGAELIDSFAWKHWKNIAQEPDWQNITIEITDIWHFVMSLALQNSYKIDKKSVNLVDKIVKNQPSYGKFLKTKGTKKEEERVIFLTEKLISLSLSKDNNIDTLIESFLQLCIEGGINEERLYTLYVGKNILNNFRQDHGYKEKNYIKNWNGREDNEVMQEILNANPLYSPKDIYDALKRIYETLEAVKNEK